MKRYPSQARYDKKNPTISVRMNAEAREVLGPVRKSTGMSYRAIILDTLRDTVKLCKRVREATINEYALYKFCESCGEPMPITDDDERLYVMDLYEADIGGDQICPDCVSQHYHGNPSEEY